MSEPLVSVLVAVFNQVDYVEQSLTSALEQDYDNLEVVVADDGSTDGTADVIRGMAAKWGSRLVPILGEERVNITANCNRGLVRCRGKYVACLAGDDLYVQGKVRKQVEWLEAEPGRVLCGHDVEAFDDTGRVLWRTADAHPLHSGKGAEYLLEHGGLFAGLSLMIRADAIPSYGYDERVGAVSDYKLQVDCLLGGGEYGFVEGVFARHRIHPLSISGRSLKEDAVHADVVQGFLRTYDLVKQEHPQLARACARGTAAQFFSEARWHARRGNLRSARRYYGAAARSNPRLTWKAAAGYAMTFAPRRLRKRVEQELARRAVDPRVGVELGSQR